MTLLLAAWLSFAPAEPSWSAPPGCPDQADVDAQIEALLLQPGPVSYRGDIELHEDGYRLSLDLGEMHRELVAADCGRLATAAALIVAVEHDPVSVADVVEPVVQRPKAHAPLPERAPVVTAPRPTPIPAPLREDSSSPPTSVPVAAPLGLLRVGVGPEVGLLPRVRAALSLVGSVQWSQWRAEVGGTASLPRDTSLRSLPDFGVRTLTFSGHARGCWVPNAQRVDVPLCGGVAIGGLWAKGFGPALSPSSRTQLWAAAQASVGLDVWLGRRIGVSARAEVDAALRQPAVHLGGFDSDPEVVRLGAVGARVLLGPALRFP